VETVFSNCSLATITSAADRLKQGGVVAFPTETVYGLGVDAENPAAVKRMYEIKGRPLDHPVIVHIAELTDVEYWAAEIPTYAIELMRAFWPGPMTLILPRSENAKYFITGGQEFVGLRIPANAIALELIKNFKNLGGKGVAAPSANRFGQISPTSAAAVKAELGELLATEDLILDGGAAEVGVESTIIDCSGSEPKILRLGAITQQMIEDLLQIKISPATAQIRVSGSLERHYAPRAKVITNRAAQAGEGLIAAADVQTPPGVIRLAAPINTDDYARSLYSALRSGDEQQLAVIVVLPPTGDGLAAAIRDRISRAAAN
jgi:L-threonylcarbamoyladenylate synthase